METNTESAADLVNRATVEELAALFAAHGEERLATRIARAVVAARPLGTTEELAEVVAAAVPQAAGRRGHPARRVFQALRVAVNDEMGELEAVLPVAVGMLVLPRGVAGRARGGWSLLARRWPRPAAPVWGKGGQPPPVDGAPVDRAAVLRYGFSAVYALTVPEWKNHLTRWASVLRQVPDPELVERMMAHVVAEWPEDHP